MIFLCSCQLNIQQQPHKTNLDIDKITLKGKWLNNLYKGAHQITYWHIFNAVFQLKVGSWFTKIKSIKHKMKLGVLGGLEYCQGLSRHIPLETGFEVSDASTLTINGLKTSYQDI